jgi:hypothetical protein
VRITAKADSLSEAQELIAKIEAEIRGRLNKWIYGVDKETLESVALKTIQNKGWRLCVVEAGLDGLFIRRLAEVGEPFIGGDMLTRAPSKEDLVSLVHDVCRKKGAEVGMGLVLRSGETQQRLHIALITPERDRTITRTYGGPPKLAPTWGINIGLDLIRKL